MTTTPTPIVDKNGKKTTVHKKDEAAAAKNRVGGLPTKPPAAVVGEGKLPTAPRTPRPIDTNELYERLRDIDKEYARLPETKTTQERHARREEYRQKVAKLESQWRKNLYNEFAGGIPDEAADAVYAKAYADGHSSGYNEVENEFRELTDLVRNAINIVKFGSSGK